MANFFLIDQSLQDAGGHHHDYVRCVAAAANEAGFLTTIGAHRRFQCHQSLGALACIKPVFRQTTYHRDSYLAGIAKSSHLPEKETHERTGFHRRGYRFSDRISAARLSRKVRGSAHQFRRRRSIREFAVDCEKFFHATMLTDQDHAFITTINEIELLGLAAYLANHPRTLQVHWHVQFHFNLFEGRTPEYRQQGQRGDLVRECLETALSRIPYHRISFHATSQPLADQYNLLEVADFEVLPYPVRPEMLEFQHRLQLHDDQPRRSESERTLRMTCPGEVRREKQTARYLQELVDEIWDDHIEPGNLQIIAQRPKRPWPLPEKINLQPSRQSAQSQADAGWVRYCGHPLDDREYLDLIRTTDFGLLFYDSRTYFSRRAGVLGELLCSGKPVIVPAGCWLGDQIAEPNFRYADSLCNSRNRVRSLQLEELSWSQDNVPLAGGVLSFDHRDHPFELEFQLQQNETAFVVEFDWHWPAEHGSYCRFDLFDGADKNLRASRIVGHRVNGMSPVAYFPASGSSVRLRIANAFDQASAGIRLVAIHTLAIDVENTPDGSVGIIANDRNSLPAAIDEMVRHFDHYRRTAAQFAQTWSPLHDPQQTIATLVSGKPMNGHNSDARTHRRAA